MPRIGVASTIRRPRCANSFVGPGTARFVQVCRVLGHQDRAPVRHRVLRAQTEWRDAEGLAQRIHSLRSAMQQLLEERGATASKLLGVEKRIAEIAEKYSRTMSETTTRAMRRRHEGTGVSGALATGIAESTERNKVGDQCRVF